MVNGRLVNRHPAYASGWASVPNSFFDFATMLGLTPYERLVWLHLFRRTQGSREVAFPSVPRLAGECGISVRSVQKAIKGLALSGMIGRRERRDHRSAPTTPEYDVAPLLRRLDSMQKRRGVVSARRDPSGGAIAYVELLDQLALAKAQLAGALSDLAEANGRLARAGREWSLALHTLEAYPAARAAVLDAVLRPEEAERAAAAGQASAGASLARPGGEPAVPADPAVPLPAGKREPELEGQARRTVYDGVAHRPIPPSWGGRIEPGTPRPRGVGGIGDPYGDGGPLDSRD